MSKFNLTKTERSWALFDCAESVFPAIMLSTFFPIFFLSIAGGGGSAGALWWASGLAVSRIIVGIAAPFIGALIDYRGFKKRLLTISIVGGSASTFLTAIIGTWQPMFLFFMLAHVFWAVSNQIYDSYLPDITTKDRMHKVSSIGYAWGYGIGTPIPYVISLLLVMFGSNFGIDFYAAVRLSVALVAIWMLAFSIPMIMNARHQYENKIPEKGLFRKVAADVRDTAVKIARNKGLLLFLIAYVLYIDGIGTVSVVGPIFGTAIGLSNEGMLLAFLIAPLVSFPFSLLFGKLSKKICATKLILAGVFIYCLIAFMAFGLGLGVEAEAVTPAFGLAVFFAMNFLVGTAQGGIWALSRSVFGKLIPPESSGEYFGFFEIMGRFAAILGPVLFAFVMSATGRSSFGVLTIVAVLAVSVIVFLSARKHIGTN